MASTELISNEFNRNKVADNSQYAQEEIDHSFHTDDEHREKLLQLPLGRIKTIIKTDPDVNLINQEAVFLIAKSTELFIDSLAKEAYQYTARSKKKTVQKRDVENAIDNIEALAFLEGMLE